MKINLNFTPNHTVEEITNYINRYILEHRNDIEIDQTKNADYDVIKYTICEEKSSLWD